MSKVVSDFMFATDDVVRKGGIAFPGFSQSSKKLFTESLKKLGVSNQSIQKIILDAGGFRNSAANLKTLIGSSKNLNVSVNKLNQILNERVKNVLAVDYKMIDDNTGIFNGYRPVAENIDRVAKILQRYAKDNGKSLDKDTATKLVNDITKNAFKDKTNKALVFDIGEQSALADKAVQRVNIGKYITAGKFKPDGRGGLIQKKIRSSSF